MSTRQRLAVGAALLVVALLGWWRWRAAHGADDRGAPAPVATPSRSAPPAAVRPHAVRGARDPRVTAFNELGDDGLSTDDPLTAYRKANVYPPGSRPLNAEQADLLHPNARHEVARPTDANDGVTFLFTADRYFLVGDDVLTTTLDVRRDGALVPVTIISAYAVVLDPSGAPPTAAAQTPIAFGPRPDGVLINTFSPASLPKLAHQTAIGMYVEFNDGTGFGTQRGHFDFQYTPTNSIPARFTGVFSDAVANGSLAIGAGIQVNQAGHYVFDCNLYDAGGSPLAWAHEKLDLSTGAQVATLSFFGKVIVDANAKGPFHIGELRGERFDPGADPDLIQVQPFAGSYSTRAYLPSDFSGDEYDSPEKQRMLQFLADQQARGVHQGAASHGDPGKTGDEK